MSNFPLDPIPDSLESINQDLAVLEVSAAESRASSNRDFNAQASAWLAGILNNGTLEPGGLPQDWRRFDLFQAIRWIEAKSANVPIGTSNRIVDDPIRFHLDVGLGFAPTAISKVCQEHGQVVLYQRVLGLFGPNGPMPIHLTEYVSDREHHHRDQTLARFADVFHHRLIQLFYRGWAQGEPVADANRGADNLFNQVVDALEGTNAVALRDSQATFSGARRDHAAHLIGHVRTQEGLEKRLSSALSHRVRVTPFRIVRDPLDVSDRLVLGRRSAASALGEAAILGTHVRLGQSSIQVDFLDLDLNSFLRYQQNSEFKAIAIDILSFHLEHAIGWRITLHLREEQIPKAQLGKSGRLGQTMWLGKKAGESTDYSLTDRSCR